MREKLTNHIQIGQFLILTASSITDIAIVDQAISPSRLVATHDKVTFDERRTQSTNIKKFITQV